MASDGPVPEVDWVVHKMRMWELWGVAPWNGPSSVDAMLKELEWEVSGPPANKSRPWIFYGRPGGSVNTLAILLATGSIASEVKCPKCARFSNHWHHDWECWTGLAPPSDLLFRRFLGHARILTWQSVTP